MQRIAAATALLLLEYQANGFYRCLLEYVPPGYVKQDTHMLGMTPETLSRLRKKNELIIFDLHQEGSHFISSYLHHRKLNQTNMSILLKLEEVGIFLLCIFFFSKLNFAWWWFPALLLLPDIGMIGYIINPKIGAFTYNLLHHRFVASLVAFYALTYGNEYWKFSGNHSICSCFIR